MFKFFKKPKIIAKLINKGKSVKVKVKNANSEQTLIILFLTVKEIAKFLGLDTRQLMNKLLDLDRIIAKSVHKAKKEAYKTEQKLKHQK